MQLEALTKFFDAQPEILATLSSPTLSRTQRLGLVETVIAQASGMEPMLANLLRLLNERSRFGALPFITRQFRGLVDSRMGRVRGSVTSASKLGDAQVTALKKQLEALTQRSVELETKVDPALLGGVIAQVGSHQYDGSLRSQLSALGRVLASP